VSLSSIPNSLAPVGTRDTTQEGEDRRAAWLLAVRFFLFALVHGLAAVFLAGVAGFVAGWAALSLLAVSMAFMARSASVFGKRQDGRLGWAAVVLLAPYLLFLWAFFHLKRWLRPGAKPYAEVAPGIFLGRRPLPGELPEEVSCVVDLTAEYFEPPSILKGRHYICLPTLNRYIPDDGPLRQLFEDLEGIQGSLYIHCGAGKGRSAAVAAGLLLRRGIAKDVHEAEQMLRRLRPCVQLHEVQRQQISRLCPSPRGPEPAANGSP